MMLRCGLILVTLLTLAPTAGCGADPSDRPTGPSGTATTASTTPPALARRPPAPGEIIVHGQTSPATHGPYLFDGHYLVRFEQYAPENPALNFASQTAFSAALTTRKGDPRGAIDLLQAAARRSQRDLTIHGRYYVDISFGDYPYIIRFTPRGA